MKERCSKFDNIKVILILMVVFSHTIVNSYGNFWHECIRFPVMFYTMPTFMFISGYFSSKQQSIGKNINRLLFPFILFSFLIEPTWIIRHPNTPVFAMWYLIVLFTYRICLPYLAKIKFIIPISLIGAIIISTCPYFGREYSLSRLICFLPFFLLGFNVKEKGSFEKIFSSNNKPIDLLCLIILHIIGYLFIFKYPGVSYETDFMMGTYSGIHSIIIRITTILMIILAGFFFIRLVPDKELFFTKYGERTLNVYVLHPLIIILFGHIFLPFHKEIGINIVLSILLPFTLSLFLFSKPIDILLKHVLSFPSKLINPIRNARYVLHHQGKEIREYIDDYIPSHKELFTPLEQFKDIHKGQRCFIVATGPSLTIEDVNKLKGEICWTCNSGVKLFEQTDWRPKYYAIADGTVFRRIKDIIDRTEMPISFYNHKDIEWSGENIFPLPCYVQMVMDEKTRRYIPRKYLRHPMSHDITKCVYTGSNITYIIIQIALYMGFSEIYLLGCDCNYTLAKTHSSLTGYKNSDKLCRPADFLSRSMIEDHEVAKKTADAMGVKIFNATRGGMLEVYPRVKLEDIL